ncbi:hypothetical protein BwiPL1_56720 (plasmid) [Bacillus wiedmannii]|nr:hypothetical protein BwiPL1_56720 [Bacillus wiedmannii]
MTRLYVHEFVGKEILLVLDRYFVTAFIFPLNIYIQNIPLITQKQNRKNIHWCIKEKTPSGAFLRLEPL